MAGLAQGPEGVVVRGQEDLDERPHLCVLQVVVLQVQKPQPPVPPQNFQQWLRPFDT